RAATREVAEGVERVFAEHDVEIVAPTNGAAIVGREAVRDHYEAVQRVLAEGRARAAPAVTEFGAEEEIAQVQAAPAGRSGSVPGHAFPRPLADSIVWFGGCLKRKEGGAPVHVHASCYLIPGERETLLIDSGHPSHWDEVTEELDRQLGGR